jgi:hypothetical protein
MKNIIFILILSLNLKAYSQNTNPDSINVSKNKNFYFQTEFLLSGYCLISNSIFESQSIYYNASVGYLITKNMNKKIKKSIQINVNSYQEKFGKSSSGNEFYVKYVDFFITPEMKFLFNKKYFDKGFYSTIGLGGGEHNWYESGRLKEKAPAWDVLFSIDYTIPIKRFYFDFKLGAGSYFAYKTIKYETLPSNYNISSQEYYDNLQKYNPNPSLKKVEITNSTIVYKYKYLGLMQGSFIPNCGINFGFLF